ncbi:hypothetical protein Mapa_007507 [Marchantia paleacea]|nr:hypothetical protein Mapa_007507 [Marchantia paleacea]
MIMTTLRHRGMLKLPSLMSTVRLMRQLNDIFDESFGCLKATTLTFSRSNLLSEPFAPC